MLRSTIGRAALAGAAGTLALDIATYADMTLRGRSSSETPAKVVGSLADDAGISPLTGADETASNRRSGAGALMGYATGIGIAVGYGLIRSVVRRPIPFAGLLVGAAAMAASDGAALATGSTSDPRSWPPSSWASDVVPHAVYGEVVARTFDALSPDGACG